MLARELSTNRLGPLESENGCRISGGIFQGGLPEAGEMEAGSDTINRVFLLSTSDRLTDRNVLVRELFSCG